MSKKKCVSKLRKKYKDVDKKSLEKIVDDIESFQRGMRAREVDPRKTLDEFIEERAINLALQRKALAENIVKSKNLFMRSLLPAFKDDPVEAMMAIMGGTIRKVPGLGPSVDTIAKQIEIRHGNMMVQGLEEIGLWKTAISGNLEKEIMIEMHELRLGGKPGLSGSKEAQKIAGVLHRVQDSLIARLQAAGSTTRRYDGYIMRQTHDPHRVFRATKQGWKEAVRQAGLDEERTFGEALGNTELEELILDEAWDQISTDSWNLGVGQWIDDNLATIRDPLKLDKRMSKSRAIHFKDGAAFYEYNQLFGRQDLMSSIHSAIIKTSRNAALIETFGTNPTNGFLNLYSKLKKHYKDDPNVSQKLDNNFDKIRGLFLELRGDTRRAGTNMRAGFVRHALAVQRMRLLGKSLITTIGDIASAAVTLRSKTGENLFSAHARIIGSFIGNMPNKAERIRVGKRLGVIVDDYLGSIYNRHDSLDAAPGNLNKLQRLFFRLNGMTAQTIHGKTTMAKIFAGDLGDVAHKGFHLLNERQQLNLSKYGIREAEWDVIRQGVEDFSGLKLVTPEAVRELGDDVFKKLRGDRKIAIKTLREEVVTKYQGYITDAVDDAIPTPGAREEAFFLRGMTEDSAWGAVARLVKQFKTVPLTLHRIHGRAAFGSPEATANTWSDLLQFDNITRLDKSTDMQNLFGFLVSSTVLGYMGLAAKDLVAGRNVRDPFSLETFKDAFVQGGGGGLVMDFGLADYDDTHRSLGADVLGPTFGTLQEAAKVAASARDIWQDGREGKEVAGEALQFIGRHTPFQNLLWTRTALDYMILHSINEYLNPGYSRRFRNKIKNEDGFWELLGWQPGDPTERLGQ